MFTGRRSASYYFRVNGGELQGSQLRYDSVPADRGDRVELVIDFDTRQGSETLFEYTIPDDDDLTKLIAGFAECRYYRGTDEWVLRPLNVNLGTDIFGRQQETLVVTVQRENRDDNPDWFIWGHNETIRDGFRELITGYRADVALTFVDPGDEVRFGPESFHFVSMRIFEGDDRLANVTYRDPERVLQRSR